MTTLVVDEAPAGCCKDVSILRLDTPWLEDEALLLLCALVLVLKELCC